MKIILTGGSGFAGSRMLYHFQQQGYTVTCIRSDMLRGELSGERLRSLAQIIKNAEPDVIVHTSAISNIAYSEKHPDESYTANVKLPETMAKLAAGGGCKLISCSSDQVYSGCAGTAPHREDDGNISPSNIYGRHKLEAEKRILDISPDAVSLRLSWMYDMPLFRAKPNNNLVQALIKSALSGRVLVYSINDLRGLTYVRSVAENLPKCFGLPGGAYNYGSENNMNMFETARAFMSAMGMTERIHELIKPAEAQPPKNLLMDCSKIRGHGIYFEPTSEGIKKLLSDYQGLFL